MVRFSQPAIDLGLVSATGQTRDGQALSYNRAPAPDLAPWIARLSVAKLRLPAGNVLSCGLFADTTGLRIQLAGNFEAEMQGAWQPHAHGPLFCGPQSRILPVRIHGDFISIGVSFRPSACLALTGEAMSRYVDQVLPVRPSWSERLLRAFAADGSPEDWLGAVEDLARGVLPALRAIEPEPVTARFEEIAFADPTMPIAEAAREIDVDRRRLERLVVRDFGMSPKQVLKRARALDMASILRGVADADEGEAMTLRYYDESHLIREFIELFGMAPRQFTALPQPILTLTLEARQARRLEMLGRIRPGERRPWQ